jgi:TrmH family RNA methyltransferase
MFRTRRSRVPLNLPPPLRSASHPLARQARALGRAARQRREEGLYLVEGPRSIAEALAAGAPVVWLLVASDATDSTEPAALAERALQAGIPVQPVLPGLLARLCSSSSGGSLLAACRLPPDCDEPAAPLAGGGPDLLLVTHGIQDPGNLGTLMRSALAFGASRVLAAGGADPWNPKVVRASAGAIHRLRVARAGDDLELSPLLLGHGFRIVAASPRGGAAPERVPWTGRVALLLGAEVAGLPEPLPAETELVTIPTEPSVESLSVAMAGAILLREASRARRGA